MSGYNPPPGVSVNDIPDNEPEKPRSQPPAPSRRAMEAADAILLPRTRRTHPDPDTDEELRREDIAAIIQRHHAASQAETVALLEKAVHRLRISNNCLDNYPVARSVNAELEIQINAHLAQLKEDGTAIEAARAQEASNE